MDFFGIGPLEMLLIFVIALIVFGPQRLPEIGRNLGKALREFRRATDDIQDSVIKEIQYEEVKKAAQEVRDTARDVRDSISLEPRPSPPNNGAVPRPPTATPGDYTPTQEAPSHEKEKDKS